MCYLCGLCCLCLFKWMSPPNNSFKQKPNKKIVLDEKSIVTLDSKHREHQSKIAKLKSETIPQLNKEKRALKQQLLANSASSNAVELQERINDLRTTIRAHQQECKNYYLDNSEIIFDYFENKQQICNGNNKTKILNDFFSCGECVQRRRVEAHEPEQRAALFDQFGSVLH